MHSLIIRRFFPIVGFASLLTACSTVDFKHPELEAKWAKGESAVTSADYLKVYDAEISSLSDQAKAEDQSVIRRLVACRDATVSELISGNNLPEECKSPPAPPIGIGKILLQNLINQRLQQLVGDDYLSKSDGIDNLTGLKFGIDQDINDLGYDEFLLDNARLTYAATRPAPQRKPITKEGGTAGEKPFDTSCDALMKVDAVAAATQGATAIKSACAALDQHSKAMGRALTTFISARVTTDCTATAEVERAAPILALYCSIWGAIPAKGDLPADTASKLESDLVDRLGKDVGAAKAANSANLDGLKEFGTNLQEAIKDLPTGYGKVEALEHLSIIVDAISRADICNEQAAFDNATVNAAKCDSTTMTPLETKASVSWAFLNSLALLSDSTNPASRSAQWLAGAQAMIAAQKVDASLQAEQQKAQLEADRLRFNAWLLEASEEAKALQYLQEPVTHPCPTGSLSCALPLYVDAVNRGTIPAAVLAGRSDQLVREYSVRRQRAAADKESQLLIAAANQLEAGTKAGVDQNQLVVLVASAIVAGAALAK
jgi:hypothetical protein